MDNRVYECKKCGVKGTLSDAFFVKFIGKKTAVRKIKHKDCNGDGKWLKGEALYIHPRNIMLERVAEEHGIHMGNYVLVKGLEDHGELKVVGIKPGNRRKLFIDVWEEETNFTWKVPVGSISKVWEK